MKKKAEMWENKGGLLHRANDGTNWYVFNIEIKHVVGASDLSWVNMYGYEIASGNGDVGKIIGDP